MHIIFGKDEAVELEHKYTVLELDLIQFGPDGPIAPAYCIVENISILDLPKVVSMRTLHENLISNYRTRNWKYCQDAIEHLQGFWGGELDTFYDEMGRRIEQYVQQEPNNDWTPIIVNSKQHQQS